MAAETRILVWAQPRDARLTCDFLEGCGFSCTTCRTFEELATEWQSGFAAVVIAGELLTASSLAALQALLTSLPAWSDPAVIVVGTDGDDGDHIDTFSVLGNVALLQRPLSLKTLRTTVQAALRARHRQYQVRDLLRQKDEADRRKDEFLAMLAHELRNPLAPLRTGLQLLRLGPSSEVVGRTYAMMERQITNLARLVDDLLDVSRITRRHITLKLRAVDLRESLRQAVDALQHQAREKGLVLAVDVPDAPVMLNGDAVRLEQMIGNVIGNAIKYTPPTGLIRADLEVQAGRAVIRVTDTGIGIPETQLPRVFELFAQAPRALDRSEGGLGIGLTVVKLLAELHGGTAEVLSAGEGAGTSVVIRLPCEEDVQPRPDRGTTVVTSSSGPRRVLIIEDNHDVADILGKYLELVGHDVIVAHDGYAGLEAAWRHKPHVLICDIGLPGVDGYEIASRLRDDPAFSSCLMIAVTGYGEVADRERAQGAGYTHHLTKPADPSVIAELISEVEQR
jgi:signal transduction histidine kinase/ActR/RegA family two-component response regulator